MDTQDRSYERTRALPAGSALFHRRERISELFADRFWLIPLMLIVAGALTGAIVSRPSAVGLPDDWKFRHVVRTSTADTLLQVMAASMLTFVGVVFAITLVALQLASSQVSPRVIRTFVRSGVTKVAFGVFLATFAYAITGLSFDEVSDPKAATRTSLVAVLMLIIAMAVFVVYVTATMRLLQVGWVITAVTNETRHMIRRGYPDAGDYVEADLPALATAPQVVSLPIGRKRDFRGELGTVAGIDRRRLVELAAKHDCVIELLPRIGEYLTTGAPVFAVHGGGRPDDAQLVACVDLGRVRTLYQDPAFGIRQLVDVAIQSLSPALNQPTTAVLVLDRLHDLLLRIARQPEPTGLRVDDTGTIRLIERTHSWTYLLDLAFDEIVGYGASSQQVTRRLAAVYADLAAELPEHHARQIPKMQQRLAAQVRRHTLAADVDSALAPDRLGLG